jgi:hypothetical protein
MALPQCLPTDPLARTGAGVDSANSLEGLIEWNSVAPSSSRERLHSGKTRRSARVNRWVGSTQAVRWRPVSRTGVALPKNLMHPLSCKPIAPVPKLANRTPLALVIDSLLVRTANYAIGDRDGSHLVLFDKFKNLAGNAGIGTDVAPIHYPGA